MSRSRGRLDSELPVVADPSVGWIGERWVDLAGASPGGPAVGVLAVPFDHAVSHRPGCRLGPERIVRALGACALYCADKRTSLAGVELILLDPIDVVHSLPETYDRIRRAVAGIPQTVTPVLLGGDHSITDPAVRGLAQRAGETPGLIVFDAHFDSRAPVPGKEHSGHWLHTLGDAIDYSRVAQLGICSPLYSESYMRWAEDRGILVRTPYEIRRRGWREVLAEAVEHATVGGGGLYLSVDIDSINQAEAPGTSVPNAGGFRGHEVVDGVFEIASTGRARALDVTEVNPLLDRDEMTVRLAADVVLNFVAGIAASATAPPAAPPPPPGSRSPAGSARGRRASSRSRR